MKSIVAVHKISIISKENTFKIDDFLFSGQHFLTLQHLLPIWTIVPVP